GCGCAYTRSRGQRNPFDGRPVTVNDTSLPGTLSAPSNVPSETVNPTRTAPGCQVTLARPSSVWMLPAMPRRTVCEPVETAGSGAATTTRVAGAVAEPAPPAPVAVTTSESVEPMSSGVTV